MFSHYYFSTNSLPDLATGQPSGLGMANIDSVEDLLGFFQYQRDSSNETIGLDKILNERAYFSHDSSCILLI